jgi:sulfatase maturation enzyme AslB (radical SAM superfamily)
MSATKELNFFPYQKYELLFTEKCNLNCTYCFEKEKLNRDMKFEDLSKLIDELCNQTFYMFGGEPFLHIDLVTDLIDALQKKDMNAGFRRQLIESLTFHITNGTLLEKHLDTIKKYNLSVQISLDGPKSVNDANRIYHDGRGSFDDVKRNIELVSKVTDRWSIHGAISREQLPFMFDIFKFHFDSYAPLRGLDYTISTMKNNVFQVVFEQDYTDEDVDIFLEQTAKTAEWIMNSNDYDMTPEQRKKLFLDYFIFRRGSSCIAGNVMAAIDFNYNMYPCHRLAMLPNRKDYTLGSLRGERNFKNFEVFNSFMKVDEDKAMYSASVSNYEWKGYLSWVNWCPAANAEDGTSVFYQNAKHNTLIAEFGAYVQELAVFHGIEVPEVGDTQNNLFCVQQSVYDLSPQVNIDANLIGVNTTNFGTDKSKN